MICRALDAGVSAAWVAGDEVYGANPGLCAELEACHIGCVLAVACDHRVGFGGATQRADAPLTKVPARAWQQISCGKGAKGNHSTGELAYYRCYTPRPVPLGMLARVAGRRWTIEERFQTGKGLVGLDQHQVHRWRSWYRWATLAMLAHAFLVVAALAEHARHPPPSGLIGLTCNELQHLFAALAVQPVADTAHRLRWSVWRRRHQARARTCQYRRQAAWQP
jgi:SRSO17 transposase